MAVKMAVNAFADLNRLTLKGSFKLLVMEQKAPYCSLPSTKYLGLIQTSPPIKTMSVHYSLLLVIEANIYTLECPNFKLISKRIKETKEKTARSD